MTAAQTLPLRLEHWAMHRRDQVAVREKVCGIWQCTTWAGYRQRVRDFALGLQSLGLQRGDRLAIASDDTPEWLVADLAVQGLGGVSVGVYPTNPWLELQYIVGHSQCRFVVCGDQEQVDKVFDALANGDGLPHLEHIICVDMKGLRHYSDPRLLSFEAVVELGRAVPEAQAQRRWTESLQAATADDVAFIVYTSGTTGPPKGAQLTHRNLLFQSDAVAQLHGLHASSHSVLCYLPLCHLAERVFSVGLHLSTGGVVNFAESIDTVQANIREIAPTLFLGVPRIWEKMQQSILVRLQEATRLQRWVFNTAFARGYARLLKREERRLPSGAPAPMGWLERAEYALLWLVVFRSVVRHLGLDHSLVRLSGAAPVSPETLRFFEVLGLPVYQVYGLTEGGLAFAQSQDACTNGCAGRPLPGIEHRLADDGEVLIKGPSVFAGYLFDPEGTRRVLGDDGWLHSGDIARAVPNGEIQIIDRKKAIIITSGGKNIAPSEIENALKESIYVRDAIIIGDGRHFLSALIQIDLEAAGHWAQQRRLAYTHYRSLSQLPEIRELVAAEVERVNKRFARVENIRKFLILGKELDQDDGELTATQKIKRSVIEKKFAAEIAEIYGTAA